MKADRHNAGKPRMDLLPLWVLRDVADVLGKAAESGKYDSWNWTKGADWSTPIASLLRHLAALQSGELIDPDDGFAHADKIVINAMFLAHYTKNYEEGNDLPKLAAGKADTQAMVEPRTPVAPVRGTKEDDRESSIERKNQGHHYPYRGAPDA